jgi:hypothetical protein
VADLAKTIDAIDVARQLGVSIKRLVRMAELGQYPELIHVTRGVYRVELSAHEMWVESRRSTACAARAELLHAKATEALRRRVLN